MKQPIAEDTVRLRKKKGRAREYTEAFLLAILIAFIIRSFGIEAFKIPSESMVPTLVVGDHIFVNKFIYGLRIPRTKIKLFEVGEPKRGEVIVFIYPEDEDKDFIKRVIGLPGDVVDVKGMDIYVNDTLVPKEELVLEIDPRRKYNLRVDGGGEYESIPYAHMWQDNDYFLEKDGEVKHIIQYDKDAYRLAERYVVPEGHLFVMGDNRDNSKDSRSWGFVPLINVKGRAMFVWMSFGQGWLGVRWNRIGTSIH